MSFLFVFYFLFFVSFNIFYFFNFIFTLFCFTDLRVNYDPREKIILFQQQLLSVKDAFETYITGEAVERKQLKILDIYLNKFSFPKLNLFQK